MQIISALKKKPGSWALGAFILVFTIIPKKTRFEGKMFLYARTILFICIAFIQGNPLKQRVLGIFRKKLYFFDFIVDSSLISCVNATILSGEAKLPIKNRGFKEFSLVS